MQEFDELTNRPDFWNDAEKAQKVLKERMVMEKDVSCWEGLDRQARDIRELIELGSEEQDEATLAEVAGMNAKLEAGVAQAEFRRMLSGPHDASGSFVSINAGAGGTESQDWAEMLLRMYTRWAQRKGYKTESLDLQPGDEAGIKSATISVEGEWAYGWLRAEAGVHRLVRISPYDANARRHT